jgi:beta-aspartyl-peptidase (threonine type)
MTNKKFGRVGDTPIIGAGTYANNRTCAVSCTGHGEYFIRKVVAHAIHCRMLFAHEDLALASSTLVGELHEIGGEGGLIAIDYQGRIAMPYNSGGMYRAWWSEGLAVATAIYAK